jgi:hypothetical protein
MWFLVLAVTEVLEVGGPGANRVNVVVIGDGYAAADQVQFGQDARWLTEELFAFEPLRGYRSFFNVTAVYVVSKDSGVDHADVKRDTALHATFDCFGLRRVVCIDYAETLRRVAEAVPDFDLAIALVNDEEYGGSGGAVPVSSLHEDAPEILRHEIGHAFVGLADEYSDPYPSYPACGDECPEPNVTTVSGAAGLKWAAWIPGGATLPTPPGVTQGVGLYEGARYQPTGIYRPEHRCKMRELGTPLCAICYEAYVAALYARVSLIDSAAPLEVRLPQTFSFQGPRPQAAARWSLDGVEVGVGATLEVDGLAPGAHRVEVVVRDEDAPVRTVDESLLEARHVWDFVVGVAGAVVHDEPPPSIAQEAETELEEAPTAATEVQAAPRIAARPIGGVPPDRGCSASAGSLWFALAWALYLASR